MPSRPTAPSTATAWRREVEELANTERDVREQTRASRIRFIAAIAGIALLAILAIWMLL